MRNRVLILGLDACDLHLIQRWMKEGNLPFISSSIQKGVWLKLFSTSDLFSEPWPSFSTGVNPARHSYFNFLQLKRGSTEIFRRTAYDIAYLPFWSLLDGKKVAAFDVPKTYPLTGINGAQIANWGEHYPLSRSASLPAGLLKEINSRFGEYSHPHEVVTPGFSEEKVLYEKMLRNVERKAKAIRFILEQEDWDFSFSVFSETHYGGHQLYHYYDKNHWAYDAERATTFSNSLPTIYSRLDTALSEICAGLSEQDTLFILSVHGIQANYSGYAMLPEVMEKLGYQVPPGNGNRTSFLGKLRDYIPENFRDFINTKLLPQSVQDNIFSRLYSNSIDWTRSTAFFLPSDQFQGFVSINLKGREPFGVINPGSEYDQLCDQICSDLKQLLNPETGKSAIRDVVKVSNVYRGENQLNLPDVVIRWAEGNYLRQLYHPKFGTIHDVGFKLRRSQHTAEGFVIAVGNQINANTTLTEASSMDLAPTILYLLGEQIPDQLDGKVLFDLLSPKLREDRKPEFQNRRLVRT